MDHWYRGYEIQIERIGSTFFAFVWRPGAKIEWGPPTVTSTDVEGTSFLLARACDRIDEELRERPGRRDVQMTPAQCRAARALIGMTQVELAGHAVVPVSVIADFEAGTNLPRQSNVDALQKALETAGVEFIVAIVRACGPRRRSEMAPREPSTAFRRPWKLEEGDESFIVRSADGGMLAAIYFEDESGRGCPSSWRSSGRAALGSNLTKARGCRG